MHSLIFIKNKYAVVVHISDSPEEKSDVVDRFTFSNLDDEARLLAIEHGAEYIRSIFIVTDIENCNMLNYLDTLRRKYHILNDIATARSQPYYSKLLAYFSKEPPFLLEVTEEVPKAICYVLRAFNLDKEWFGDPRKIAQNAMSQAISDLNVFRQSMQSFQHMRIKVFVASVLSSHFTVLGTSKDSSFLILKDAIGTNGWTYAMYGVVDVTENMSVDILNLRKTLMRKIARAQLMLTSDDNLPLSAFTHILKRTDGGIWLYDVAERSIQ